MSPERAYEIVVVFGSASLLSFGGGNAVIPQIQLEAVHTYHWLTSGQFADAFAIAQAAPGPSTLLVSAIGYQAAGIMGAILATVAMILPACLLMFFAARLWFRTGPSRWRSAVENGLAPIAVGLVLSSAIVIAKSTEHNLVQVAMTVGATVVLCATKLNPLWIMGVCGLIGYLTSGGAATASW
jgi:chromate transporter